MGREIGKGTFPGCLWDIYKKGYTGGLRVERGSLWKEVYFENGLPVGSRSNIIQECLGRLLVRSGRLAPEKCEDSLIIMNGLRVRQGEALVKMGLIKEEELPEILRLQLRVRLLDLFGWVDGIYRLREGDVQRITPLNEKIGRLIIDGVKEGYSELEKVLLPLIKGKYLKKSDSYDNAIRELGLEIAPPALDGNPVDAILSADKDLSVLLYVLLLAGALRVTDLSEDAERLAGFYEKVKGKNHFEILGVPQGSKDAEIKKAYYNLAKQYHPDLYESNPDKKIRSLTNEIFCLIASAYEVLGDERSRREYEDRLKRGSVEGDATSVSRILLAEMEFKKGQNFLRFGNFDGALTCFQKAVEMNPDEAEFYAYLGWALYNKAGKTREDGERAREHVKKAISINPRMAMAYYFLGFIGSKETWRPP